MNLLVAGLVIVLASVWFWYSAMAAREAANLAAIRFCARQELQFLDGTVAFARLRVATPHAGGWALRRIFSFEFSVDGMTRRQGFVTVDGRRVMSVDLPPEAIH